MNAHALPFAATAATSPPAVEARGLSKAFGPVQALVSADLSIAAGEVCGLVGHNGAGKSTLMNLFAGVFDRDAGDLVLGGRAIGRRLSAREAHAAGVRCVFQELSLCANLDAAENTRLVHPGLSGLGWRRRAERVIEASLDAVFPEHGIDIRTPIGEFPIATRQMIEIARGFSVLFERPRLVILDEPTSSLDERRAGQLLAYVRRAADEGISTILITHKLNEIFAVADRITVMRDGAIVADRPAAETRKADLVALMGGVEHGSNHSGAAHAIDPGRPPVLAIAAAGPDGVAIAARRGDLIGFAGLDGHGQREALRTLARRGSGLRTAYVAGDRQSDGVFPLWSIAQNLSICALESLKSGGLLSRRAEIELAQQWKRRIGIRTDDLDRPLLTLSGGNQQKVLFARALASDAELILLDDPMRGVDIGTKQEVYRLIRAEAEKGRTFVWYSTELEELTHCNRVYVFRDGHAVAELPAAEVTPARIIEASFSGGGHG